jgi:hypothetical protein
MTPKASSHARRAEAGIYTVVILNQSLPGLNFIQAGGSTGLADPHGATNSKRSGATLPQRKKCCFRDNLKLVTHNSRVGLPGLSPNRNIGLNFKSWLVGQRS